jgi:5-(carboxyamino)imidazole ribonucleotide mutase
MQKPRIVIVMGSDSDWKTLSPASEVLDSFGITHEVRVLSAHRMPDEMAAFAKKAGSQGFQVIIAGAGGAAHLPGMIASHTTLPIIGVPVPLQQLEGLDSLLSIAQMPAGVPVATVGIGNAKNAALLAARIIALSDPKIARTLQSYKGKIRKSAIDKGNELEKLRRLQRTKKNP